jgi:bifunctional DNase/RNase
MYYDEIPDDAEFLKNLHPTSDLDLIEVEFYKVTVDSQDGSSVGLYTTPDKIIGIDFNSIEGTMLTFVVSGCADNSHLRTIYHLYLETMNLVKFNLDKVVIESKRGDMIYARLHWIDHKGRKIFKVCSAADATVLALMSNKTIYVIKKVLDDLEDYTEYDNNLKYEEE